MRHLVIATTPCYVQAFSWCNNKSWHWAYDYSFSCLRDCAIMPSIKHRIWVDFVTIESSCLIQAHLSATMSHDSSWCWNKPWQCAHDSSSHLIAQGIEPLCHHREGRPHLTSCHYGYELHTNTCREAYVYQGLLMCFTCIQGLALKPLGMATPIPPNLPLSYLPSLEEYLKPFWKFLEKTSLMLEKT